MSVLAQDGGVELIQARLRSHRLSAPAATVEDAAEHMLAVQAQEFWGGRWALAVRTRGRPTLRDVDRSFDRGELVRSWTQRGTIHAVPARDLAWLVSLTGERQRRQAAAIHRREGIDDAETLRAEGAAVAALRGGNRLERAELFAALEAAGVGTSGQRGYHLLTVLANRGIVCLGPVVPRETGPTREQYVVLVTEWCTDAATPADPLAELFARYIDGHAPASARDFAWWSGLPLGVARDAAAAAEGRVRVVAEAPEPVYAPAAPAPRRSSAAPDVVALGPFEEYYISYVDRAAVCDPAFLDVIGPAKNGIVRPVLLARGRIVGTWTHSLALGRRPRHPIPDLFAPDAASDAELTSALTRFLSFLS